MGIAQPLYPLEKSKIAQRFANAEKSYDQSAIAQQHICQKLRQLLLQQVDLLQCKKVLEIGCGTGELTRQLMDIISSEQWIVNDLYASQYIQALCQNSVYRFIQGDAEQWPFSGDFDLVVSASTFQWFEQPQRFLDMVASHLSPNGILLFSTFAPENLNEIRFLTEIGLTYPKLQQWRQWLEQRFTIISLEQDQINLDFSSPLAVLQHLKQTGVTAVKQQSWNKQRLTTFCQQYRQSFTTTQQQVSLTYHPIYCLAIRK
ncbi:malonyl-[acyl-carrier protein] O-methyltransferase BioC [Mergibacter septicus]|uniref:malonyl-ACP O-methyltransferase BioC n=1 Tax=Mergibacter septicus TaxID=221402 RepID=UPI0011791B5D|nr:malonyl-ACP O-methyltransferase BioC [Mergibacter septicus]AWX13387.1 malonyl-[acyl-carrier protein] O-methyltransferase BioC [Mergibacter septicus]